jgi:hypothetical protein
MDIDPAGRRIDHMTDIAAHETAYRKFLKVIRMVGGVLVVVLLSLLLLV